MKRIHAPHLGRSVVVGGRRRPAAPSDRTLRLRDYMAAGLKAGTLPTPPTSVDYSAKAKVALANVYDNNSLGDCVIAGFYHVLGVATGNASGSPFIASEAQILADYEAIGGYVPGNASTDNGCDELTALQYWQSHGAADGSKLAGWAQVDPSSLLELQTGLWLVGSLYFGFSLPDAWISPFPSDDSFVWDAAGDPDPENGHCVMSASYDASAFGLATWGLYGKITAAAIAKYGADGAGGAVYVPLTPDWIAQGMASAPSGIDWATLQADLALLCPPPSAPASVPPSVPPAPPSAP